MTITLNAEYYAPKIKSRSRMKSILYIFNVVWALLIFIANFLHFKGGASGIGSASYNFAIVFLVLSSLLLWRKGRIWLSLTIIFLLFVLFSTIYMIFDSGINFTDYYSLEIFLNPMNNFRKLVLSNILFFFPALYLIVDFCIRYIGIEDRKSADLVEPS